MRIGYVNPEYGARRMIINKSPAHEYVRVRSFKSLGDKFMSRFRGGLHPYYFIGGVAEDLKKVNLYHFWNNIALWPCRTPYVTSFESELPRKFPEGDLLKRGIESLLSSQCRKTLAFSQYAKNVGLAYADSRGFGEISAKCDVLLPPQDILVGNLKDGAEVNLESAVRFIFVGKDFFRKGGSEIVRALVCARKDVQIEAWLIGDFDHVDYASSWRVDSADEMRRIFADNKPWLHHIRAIPNAEMLSLAKTCHIGLLPTRHDTFGYSVLEFQACGLPCITTDVCSLPEVNNDDIGWLVNVSRSTHGVSTDEAIRELSISIQNGLTDIIRKAAGDPEAIMKKRRLALENLKVNHDPVRYGEKLDKIYMEALG